MHAPLELPRVSCICSLRLFPGASGSLENYFKSHLLRIYVFEEMGELSPCVCFTSHFLVCTGKKGRQRTMSTKSEIIIDELRSLHNPKNVEGMARFGIRSEKALGITIPKLRQIAKTNRRDHELALELWASEFHEARILASMVDDYKEVTEDQAESWLADFNSWDLCDQCIMNLFEDLPFAWDKAVEWSSRAQTFEKRAGFVMMARLAVSDKKADDKKFDPFLPIIIRESTDDRNMVKKAVNWALRQIGKRSIYCNKKAIETGKTIAKINNKAAKWIAADALRELTSEAVRRRLGLIS